MAADNTREHDERDEDERDEDEESASEPVASGEPAAPDPNVPRNRAERRMAAKAARRGREAKLADDSVTTSADDPDNPEGLLAPTTSIGGGTQRLDESPQRSRVPPRTMSKGTGNAEGVPEWAIRIGDWFALHRRQVVMGAIAAVVLVGGAFGWRAYAHGREAKATRAYYDGLSAMFAAILPEEPAADDPRRDLPHYRSFEVRAQAAVEKLRTASRDAPEARANALIRLSEASALYELGRYAEAKTLYQGVQGADLAGLEGRALEGLAFSLESLDDLDGAMARYRELQNVQGGIYRDQAQYYQARLHVRRNDEARAKELLRAVIERVGRPAASDPTASIQSALRNQCLTLLRDLDPSDPAVVAADRQRETSGGGHGHGGSGLPDLQGLPPELREQLQKMLRERGVPRGGGN